MMVGMERGARGLSWTELVKAARADDDLVGLVPPCTQSPAAIRRGATARTGSMRTRHAGKEREEQPISEGQLLARFAFSIPLPDWDLPNLPRLDLPDIPWPDLPVISWLECRGNNRYDDLCGSGDRLQGAVPARVSSHSRLVSGCRRPRAWLEVDAAKSRHRSPLGVHFVLSPLEERRPARGAEATETDGHYTQLGPLVGSQANLVVT
jgi:hypothetical protein